MYGFDMQTADSSVQVHSGDESHNRKVGLVAVITTAE